MESKAEQLAASVMTCKKLGEEIEQFKGVLTNYYDEEIERLTEERELYNYKNPDVIMRAFDKYVDEQTQDQQDRAQQQAEEQLDAIHYYYDKLKLKYRKLSSWYIRKKKPDKVIESCVPRIYENTSDIHVENASLVMDVSGKFKYIMLGLLCLIFGPAILVYKLVCWLAEIFFDMGFADYLLGFACGAVAFYYWGIFLGSLVEKTPMIGSLLTCLILLIIIFVVVESVASHNELKKDADMFLAIFSPEDYLSKCYNAIMSDYDKKVLYGWRQERELISTGGHGQLIDHFTTVFTDSYNRLTKEINDLQDEAESGKRVVESKEKELAEISEQIDGITQEARKPVTDSEYNECVLTNYVTVRVDGDDSHIETIKHNAGLFVVTYNEEAYENLDELRKKVSEFIEEFYYGLIDDNYHGIVDYHLIDYETGGALLSFHDGSRRLFENEIIQVCGDNQARSKLYGLLKLQKEKVLGTNGTGDIKSLNPKRIAAGDDPLPYYVVIHYGKEARKISGEDMQLYLGADKIGFVPIFIMSKAEYDKSIQDEQSEFGLIFRDKPCIDLEWN